MKHYIAFLSVQTENGSVITPQLIKSLLERTDMAGLTVKVEGMAETQPPAEELLSNSLEKSEEKWHQEGLTD